MILLLIFEMLGVSHLSGTLVERFAREQPELRITDDEIKCVKLAGYDI